MRAPIKLATVGFRIFFFGGALYAILSMALWSLVFRGYATIVALPPVYWHAHEMIYGFSAAIVAGFLLTAVRNWTGYPTLQGKSLILLFSIWAAARIVSVIPVFPWWTVWLCNALFFLGLFGSIAIPLWKAKQYRQMGILAKVLFLAIGDTLFFLGSAGYWPGGSRVGLYLGFYILLAMIITIGSRVFPLFISRGVNVTVRSDPHRAIGIVSLVGFLVFMVCDLAQWMVAAQILAGGLGLLYGYRLARWYTPKVWTSPLVWSLLVSYGCIVAGFFAYAMSTFFVIPMTVVTHLFAVGGIGLVILSMISRVAWGHSGRSFADWPKRNMIPFLLMIAALIFRVVCVYFWPAYHPMWILMAQLAWIASFLVYFLQYFKVLVF